MVRFSFFWKHAGLGTVYTRDVALHLFPCKGVHGLSAWSWGYHKDWYDGPWHSFGVGPFLLLCWT